MSIPRPPVKPSMWCPGIEPYSPLCPPLFWPLWEGSGDTSYELRERFTATFEGTASWGADGVLLSTAGTDGKVVIPFDARLAPASAFFTWECLFRVDTSIGNFARVYTQGGFGGPVNIRYRTAGDPWRATIDMSVDSPEMTGGTSATVGAVHYIAVTVDGAIENIGRLYQDGVLVGTNAADGVMVFDAADFELGERLDGTYMGATMHPGIALSPAQIHQRARNFFRPLEARRVVMPLPAGAPPVGAIMNQIQKANLGADLFDGTLVA